MVQAAFLYPVGSVEQLPLQLKSGIIFFGWDLGYTAEVNDVGEEYYPILSGLYEQSCN
jgi:hypothetical protein